MPDDTRLIEDYIPIEAISAEARREKSIRKGHISTLHLWWARRPLVAARAAVYGALVPAPKDKKERKAADEFVTKLCKYPGSPDVIKQAQKNILQAHAERLTAERGELVTLEDIEAGRAPRPRVLDMFAGGGSIPLEALRLGCEAYAMDLNPVAHLIELCTLVYPQQYGAPDPSAKGCSADGTWAGLSVEVEHWGKWVLEKVRAEIGDLYPPIPDPESQRQADEPKQLNMNLAVQESKSAQTKSMLNPIAYLWTRTVTCKNPDCGATVPLARQTWLAEKKDRFVALQPLPNVKEKRVHYRVVEAASEKALGFDPEAGSKSGNVGCPFCGTVADSAYIKEQGKAKKIGVQLIALICTRPGKQGKIYLATDNLPTEVPNDKVIWDRIKLLEKSTGNDPIGPLTVPDEDIEANPRSMDVQNFGFLKWADLFTNRQMLSLLTFTKFIRSVYARLLAQQYSKERAKATVTYLGLWLDKIADYGSSLTHWHTTGEKLSATYARQALPMVWDFPEINPLSESLGNAGAALNFQTLVIKECSSILAVGKATRGSATELTYKDNHFDAIVTDPPYYDNVTYSNLSDLFYVWLKRTLGHLYPEHFSFLLTPKKKEAIAAFYRHDGDRNEAKVFYENLMAQAFAEAGRVLKANAPLVVVYAHKTTLGWSTLIDALRRASFTVTEAWPLDTEMGARVVAQDTAALASSIFLVSRRREHNEVGSYERDVRPELQAIVRERVDRLWAQGVTGADLVIACVGAGLRAFTKYAKVEYANGQPVPADTFLAEVEGAVLEALLEKLFGVASAGIGGIDPVTRFYILWRYAYRGSAIDAGEAIVFAYPQRVELEGPNSLTYGNNALVVRLKNQYLLRDFTERGPDEELGLPSPARRGAGGEVQDEGKSTALIDILHRLLWLVENRPALIPAYLDEAKPDIERLRLVAQTLGGHTLEGNGSGGGRSLVAARGAEASALRKLTTNWRTLIESHRGTLDKE
jgi:putative DNA methylase